MITTTIKRKLAGTPLLGRGWGRFSSFIFLSLLTACSGLDGDNADFDFDGKAQTEDPTRVPESLRLATYNTHRCSPPNSSTANYDAVAQVVGRIDADIIALQELDNGTKGHPENQLQELASRTGLQPVFCKTVNMNGGEYGIGVLAKTTPLQTDAVDLPGVEARKFLVCEMADYVFIATHLCVSSAENRQWSFDIIGNYVRQHYADDARPVYLAGDLNTSSLPQNAIDDWRVISTSANTFPSQSKRIDYILVYKHSGTPYEVVRTMIPAWSDVQLSTVSDHLPVIVDLKQ